MSLWPHMALCTAAVLSTAADQHAAAETFTFGSLPITVPDGFVVEQVAAPPLVERPVTLAFDEVGRLYVTESSGSNEPLDEQQVDPRHRVLCLEDVDRDGVFDRRTVFAEGLMMLQGSLWHDGSLYVAAAPEILRLTDTDGDGTADERVVWHDGGTLTGCGNDLHGPAIGPDGRIVFTKGAFAEQTHNLAGRSGWTTRASHVFRCRPDGSELESVLTGGMDNPVDVAFTASGDRLLSATFLEHPSGGLRDGVVHAVYGGVFGKEHGVLDGHPRTGDLLPVLLHLGPAAACGLHVHSGFGLTAGGGEGEEVFVCSFNLRSVTRHRLTPAGSSYAVTSEPFLSADSADFHPTDVIEDADGSLLVVDTGGWYKLCCPTSQLEKPEVFGGIYRIRRRAARPATDPRGLDIDWPRVDGQRLTALLGDLRPVVAWRAVEELARRRETGAIREVLAAGGQPVAARLHGVWSLARIDTADAHAAVRMALHDPDPTVRRAAAHAAGLHRDREAVPELAMLLARDDAGVARVAAEALGRIGGAEAVAALLAGSRRATDRFLMHAVTYGLIEAGLPEPLLDGTHAESPCERQAALIALDQMPLQHVDIVIDQAAFRERVKTAVQDPDPSLRETALWVMSTHAAWADDLADDVPGVLAAAAAARAAGGDAVRHADRAVGRLASVAMSPRVAAVLASECKQAAESGSGIDLVALDVMRAAQPQEMPDAWVDAIAMRLDGEAGDVERRRLSERAIAACITTLSEASLTADQRRRLRSRMIAVAESANLSPSVSLRAAALITLDDPLPASVIERLLTILAGVVSASPMDRAAAGDLLAVSPLPAPVLERLAAMLPMLPAAEITTLLPRFAEPPATMLPTAFASLGRHPHPDTLPRKQLAELVSLLQADARTEYGDPLLAAIDTARGSQRQAYEQLVASLPPGDAARGHRVFLSDKAACITCHAMAYAGGRIGPDLTRIGSIRTKGDLLEAILLPSASFVRSYEPVTVLRTDGRIVTGIIRDERPHDLVVQTSATTRETVARDAIEAIAPGTASLMPAGYEKLLSRQEIADLVAFLERAR